MKHRIFNQKLFAEAAWDAVLILIAAALLLCGARLGVHRFRGIMGCDGYYQDVHIAGSYVVRTYYAGSPLLRNGYPIAVNFGFADEISEYAADLDGDGVTELVCNTGVSAAQVGSVCVYKAENGVIRQGTFPLEGMGVVRDAADVPLVFLRYEPEMQAVSVSYTTLPGYENAPTSLPMEQLEYQLWSCCR